MCSAGNLDQYLPLSLGLIRVLMCLCLYLCCDDDNHCINIICQVESHLIINVVHQRQGSTLILLSNYLISSPSQWDANTTSALSEPIHQLYKDFWLLVGHHIKNIIFKLHTADLKLWSGKYALSTKSCWWSNNECLKNWTSHDAPLMWARNQI